MRVAVYARYSSDNQREASIEDQLEVCRRYVGRQGWTMGQVYADQALSGASRFRPAFQQMLADAEQRRFDVIVVEALDRLSRKLADVAELHDRLSFLRIGLHTVATGEITPMHVGMLGTMAQMYLKDWPRRPGEGSSAGRLKERFRAARRMATTSCLLAWTAQASAGSIPRRRQWSSGSSRCSLAARARARSRSS
jgi:site-specific DNA recombinase